MKRIGFLLLLLIVASTFVPRSKNADLRLYLQFVQGSDDASPPSSDARPAGPILKQRLQLFKWKHFWEIKRKSVVLEVGSKTRQRLSPHCEVEIEMAGAAEMTVSIYSDGKLAGTGKQAAAAVFYIVGGDYQDGQSWFVVVRHDQPKDPVQI
jgi:hypothetical protein